MKPTVHAAGPEDPASSIAGVWVVTGAGALDTHTDPATAGGQQPRPAAALAGAVHQLLGSLTGKRARRLDSLRERVQEAEHSLDATRLESALQALQQSAEGLDFMATRGDRAKASGFVRQGAEFGAVARRASSLALEYVGRHAAQTAVIHLLWIELMMETKSMNRRARKAGQWLAEMAAAIAQRRAGAGAPVALRALEELQRRGLDMEQRLRMVEDLCGSTRAARRLAQVLAEHRAALCRQLQERLRSASLRLQHILHPLLEAGAQRPLEPVELLVAIDARHALLVALTQAVAELAQVKVAQRELATQLGWLQGKAKRLG